MKVKYFLQSCFLITSDNGTRILTDPYHNMPGFKQPAFEADIVTVSHSHSDHNNTGAVKGGFMLINKPEYLKKGDIEITGIETYHDNREGSQRGRNILFKYVIDGLNICHCGDLGHILTDGQLNKIGKIDILLLPVGGVFTIDANDAVKVMRQINPIITIPMHYKSKVFGPIGLMLGSVDKFITLAGIKSTELSELEVASGSISQYQGIITLKIEN